MFPDRVIDAALRLDAVLATDAGFGGTGLPWEAAVDYAPVTDPARQDVVLRRRVPLPSALRDQYAYLESKCFIGLLPEIHRAWFTIDSRLFLWDYAGGKDLYPFEGVDQIIVSIGLAPPRPGVFVEDIRYVLVVSTPVEILLLGVCFGPDGSLTLVPTEISVVTDGVAMLKIVGADNSGRVFLAGRDGCLHELVYGETGLLSSIMGGGGFKKARLVNRSPTLAGTLLPSSIRASLAQDDPLIDLALDESRHALYSLSEKGRLTLYFVGDGTCKKLDTADCTVHAKRYSVGTMAPSKARGMVAIFPNREYGATAVHLIVVTSFGERLYYSTQPSVSRAESGVGMVSGTPEGQSSRPSRLHLIGWRPSPPSTGIQATPLRVYTSLWSNGALLLSDARDMDSDVLVSVFPDRSPYQGSLMNVRAPSPQTLPGVGGLPAVRESVVEIPLTQGPEISIDASTGPGGRAWAISEVSRTQRQASPDDSRDFIVLTNAAIHLYTKLRPIDRMRKLLSGGPSQLDVNWFIQLHGPAESCAVCLGIISGLDRPVEDRLSETDRTTADRAGELFRSMSGEPQLLVSGSFGDMPTNQGQGGFDARFDAGRPSSHYFPVVYSAGHDGMVICLARTLRRVWTCYVTSSRDPSGFQELSISANEMRAVRSVLSKIQNFMSRHVESFPADQSLNEHGKGNIQERLFSHLLHRKKADEARRIEVESIESMGLLCSRAKEALALLSIMDDHRLHRLFASLSDEVRRELTEMRFGELVASGRGEVIAGALLEALFASYSDDQSAVDSLGESLRSQAPSFFGGQDAIVHRGLNLIRQALRLKDQNSGPTDRIQELATLAVKTLEPVAAWIFDLPSVCSDLRALGAVPGLVQLCLRFAEPDASQERRHVAFACIFEALRPLVVSRSSTSDPTSSTLKDMALQVAFASKDDEFLSHLFTFLMELGPPGVEELLARPSSRVERFLLSREGDGRNLMWKFYSQHGRFVEAATILLALAEDAENSTSLDERVNLLSTALLNSRAGVSQGETPARTQTKELSDRVEVARVQLKIRDELRRLSDPESSEALVEIEGQLFDLSTLYNNYARPWELWISELEILRCAGYRDDGLVRRLWAKIIDKELGTATFSDNLKNRIITIGKEFYPSDLAFPLPWLVHLLEREHLTQAVSRGTVCDFAWVPDVFLQIGVTLDEVFLTYHAILENLDIFDGEDAGDDSFSWGQEASQVHLMKVVEALLLKVGMESRAQAPALDALALCRSRLRGMSHREAPALLTRLDALVVRSPTKKPRFPA